MTAAPARAAIRAAVWRSLIAPALATVVALAILVALGVWQLERKAWKEDLLSQINTRAYGEPVPIAAERAWPRWRADADEFRRVRLNGTFRPAIEIPVHGLAKPGREVIPGVYVFAALRLDDGASVVINRGFVPMDVWKAGGAWRGLPEGPVTIVGLERSSEVRGSFVPTNDAARGEWFVRDLGDMARHLAVTRVAPFYVDADATPNPGGWPRGGQTQMTLPNDHLQYAITWFGLAASLIGVFAAFAWRRLFPLAADEAGRSMAPSGAATHR